MGCEPPGPVQAKKLTPNNKVATTLETNALGKDALPRSGHKVKPSPPSPQEA